MATDELVNRPLIKAWLWSALVWLTAIPLVGCSPVEIYRMDGCVADFGLFY